MSPRPHTKLRARWAREARALAMVAADFAGLATAGILSWLAWAAPVHAQPLGLYLQLWPLTLLFLLGYALAGLYPGNGLGPVETMRRQTYVTLVAFLVVSSVSFALKLPYVYSRVTFALAFAFALLLVPAVRLAMLALVSRTSWWPEPVVLATDGLERARKAIEQLSWNRNLGYAPQILLWLGDEPAPDAPDLPAVAGTADREALARELELVLLATSGPASASEFDALHRQFRRVLVVRELDELPVEGIRIRNLGSLLGIEYTNNLLDRRNRALKRALDLVLGASAVALSAPLVLAAIVALKLRSPGPAFFRQERTGEEGRRIRVPKIRTMAPGAERRLEEAMERDPALRREWSETMKMRNDPRLIPGLGRFLRRWSLDELPQLWSVLRGDMSLVGPRPFPDYHLAHFSTGFQELRTRVRPGITGLWQVNVRSDGSLAQQESLDTYYIRNWSLWLDLYILARTAKAVLSGRGAY